MSLPLRSSSSGPFLVADKNESQPLVVDVGAGTKCTGTVGGVKNVCLMKCQNPVGPFGGVVPFQVVAAGGKMVKKTF
jgi:hypothetical protein